MGEEEAQDLAAAGLADPPAPGDDADYEIGDDCAPAIRAFLVIQTQVRVDYGAIHGFDYQGVRAGLAMAGVKMTPALFQDLRIIEGAAVAAWAEQAEHARDRWRSSSN